MSGLAESILEEGFEKGKLNALIRLVKDGLLTVEEAARRLQKSVEEIKSLL